ncbi:MAG: hypothetical protein ABW174_14570 [Flavitalea sp.]
MGILFFADSNAQSNRKISTTIFAQGNLTLHDYTIGNNPWAIGMGFQTEIRTKSRFSPMLEITGDAYLADDKVLRVDPDGNETNVDNDVPGMVNIFGGAAYRTSDMAFVALTAGPSLINGKIFFGIKPAFGFYFDEKHRWTGKLSYIHVFDRTKLNKQDFVSLSAAIGVRLF